MSRIVILDAFTSDQGQPLWESLQACGEVQRYDRTPASAVVEHIGEAEIVLTNKVRLDAQVLAACPRLRYIGILATGYNHIDLDAARQRGIAVTNAPGYSTDSVAQLVIAFMLHHFSGVERHATAVAGGEWSACPDFCFFRGPLEELSGKTLLIIGRGAIGSAVARISEAFGMRVIAGQVPGRPPTPDRLPLAEALPQADIISLHCPLTEHTVGLVDGTFLNACKSNAILINTGRGPLVDDAALLFALDHGLLAAAYLDVLAEEPPPPEQPLLAHPRVILTPHIGWGTDQARQRLVRIVTDNLVAWQGGEARNRVDL